MELIIQLGRFSIAVLPISFDKISFADFISNEMRNDELPVRFIFSA